MNERSARFFDGMFDRTLIRVRRAWRDVAETARSAIGAPLRPDLPREDRDRLKELMQACLEARGGEVAARAKAAELGRDYLSLSATGRKWFLRVLADNFDLDRAALDAACHDLLQASRAERPAAERGLRRALVAPRVKLLTLFNGLPEGVKFLVDMRAELMKLAREDAALSALEQDLKGLLASWFDIGFLELQRITWDSPAGLLEKLMVYEAVHEIRSWGDLKNRLEADRRCFAFFHPRMPEEPLIFVEVALVKGMADNIDALLDESAPLGDPAGADAAIFYSISNCQSGLAGISFGDFLIKRVVDRLVGELPGLKIFATLSPIPGFRSWLDKELATAAPDLLTQNEQRALAAVGGEGEGGSLAALLARPNWHEDEAVARALKDPLLRLCARYLLHEKGSSGRARDPVAHFHLSNGARMERLDWLGDRSRKGLQQSAGIMINYLYRQADIETNHTAYTGEGRVVAAPALRALLRG